MHQVGAPATLVARTTTASADVNFILRWKKRFRIFSHQKYVSLKIWLKAREDLQGDRLLSCLEDGEEEEKVSKRRT